MVTFPATIAREVNDALCAWSLSPRAWMVVVAVAMTVGCRTFHREGPVSSSLAACRQSSQRGIAAMEQGDWAGAERWLTEAVESCDVDPESHRFLGEVLWHRGATQEALSEMRMAVSLAAEDPVPLVRVSEMCLELGEVQNSRVAAEAAIAIDPRRADAWIMRARSMGRLGNSRQALADYHRALAFEPRDRVALFELAELYRELGEPRRALSNLQSLRETYASGEDSQQVIFLEGIALSSLGRHGEAADAFRMAATRFAPTAEILWRMAEAELLCGRPEEARRAAGEALHLEPRNHAALALLERIDMAEVGEGGSARR